jgi:hypothetical protein
MMKKPLVDPVCRALAVHFHPTGTNAQLSELAKLLEDVAVEFVHGRRDGRHPSLISSEKTVSLSRLALRIRLAEIAYAKALVALYPVNTPATYVQNRKCEVGCTVIGHSGNRVKVRGHSGAEYYVRGEQMVPATKAGDKPEQ